MERVGAVKGVCVAAPASGSGKTLAVMGLVAALTRRGLAVQCLKAGPDYIDPTHHTALSGRPSHNVDGWMLGWDDVLDIARRAASGTLAGSAACFAQGAAPPRAGPCDVLLLEGAMGLYDGAAGDSEEGSAAQLARWLGLPVLLVIDARSMARSIAAVAHGFATFQDAPAFVGCLANRVNSATHRALLEEAFGDLASRGGPPLLGALSTNTDLETPSRHLGLVMAQEEDEDEERRAAHLADWMEQAVDLDALLARLPDVSGTLEQPARRDDVLGCETTAPEAVRLAVARDEAFCFYYEENFRLLQRAGAELVFFSPMRDRALPEDIHGLYLGGGYPELHAQALSDNVRMRRAVKAVVQAGAPLYAECGGYMYCMRALRDVRGLRYLMADLFPWECAMDTRRRGLGYREVTTTRPSLLGPTGTVVRGHEFHYSYEPTPPTAETLLDAGVEAVYAVTNRRGEPAKAQGYALREALASYVHLHFGGNPHVASAFVARCRRYRQVKE